MSKRTVTTAKKSTRSARAPATAREPEEVRLNVTLPVRLHRAIKVEAAKRQQTIRALIIELLKKEGITASG